MKLIAGLLILGGVGGGLALTNPSPETYAEAASYKLVEKLQTETCGELSNPLGINLQEQCQTIVADLRPQLQGLIGESTTRSNLGIASHYKTTLSAGALLPEFLADKLPSFEVESVGIGTQILFYRAEEVPAADSGEG